MLQTSTTKVRLSCHLDTNCRATQRTMSDRHNARTKLLQLANRPNRLLAPVELVVDHGKCRSPCLSGSPSVTTRFYQCRKMTFEPLALRLSCQEIVPSCHTLEVSASIKRAPSRKACPSWYTSHQTSRSSSGNGRCLFGVWRPK